MKNTLYKRIFLFVISFLFILVTLFSFFPTNRRNLVAAADINRIEHVNDLSYDYENMQFFLDYFDLITRDDEYISYDSQGNIQTRLYPLYDSPGEYHVEFFRFRSSFIDFIDLTPGTYVVYFAPFSTENLYFTLYDNSNSSYSYDFESWGLYFLDINTSSTYNFRVTFDNYSIPLSPGGSPETTFNFFTYIVSLESFFTDMNTPLSRLFSDYELVVYDGDTAYEAGYASGRDDGYRIGYNDGLSEGLAQSNENSFNDGYNKGYQLAEQIFFNKYYEERYNEGKQVGYDEGYDKGYKVGNEVGKSEGFEKGYDEGTKVASDIAFDKGKAEGRQDGYNDGYEVGREVGEAEGFTKGSLASGGGYSFLNLMASVVDAPIQAFTGLFNFEILGFNMSSFFTALLTACILMTVIKMLL